MGVGYKKQKQFYNVSIVFMRWPYLYKTLYWCIYKNMYICITNYTKCFQSNLVLKKY